MVGTGGQVRMDTLTNRLVRLIRAVYDVSENGVRTYRSDWFVADVLTGDTYRLNMLKWSEKSYNEMEVLAWASK